MKTNLKDITFKIIFNDLLRHSKLGDEERMSRGGVEHNFRKTLFCLDTHLPVVDTYIVEFEKYWEKHNKFYKGCE